MTLEHTQILVETQRLTKRFGARTAVDHVDLQIPSGVAFGLLGPNGAGKTTLIRTLLGLTRVTAGNVRVMGHAVPGDLQRALARVGAVVEEPRFHSHLSGRENLRIIAALLDDDAERRIPDVLQRVGLAARADERVSGYSLGMRQRLGIARCLLNDPLLLILDEPMNGLDPAGMQEVRVLIRSFVDEGRTVLISSHLLDEVEKTCDMCPIIDRGRLIRQGSIEELRGGAGTQVVIECDDSQKARRLMLTLPWVTSINIDGPDVITCTLTGGSAAELNRSLVYAGVAVSRIDRPRVSLEERFLDMTTRLERSEEAIA
jgi:ABC-2 type transport system ATP-binding protein